MMGSITGFSLENCERDIKFCKKMVKGQVLWVMFNLSITCFDWSILDDAHSKLTGMGFGAMVVTTLWSLIFLIESWSEWRTEKLRHKFLTELHDTQLASGERQQYLSSKQYYDQLRESLEKNNESRTV